MESSMKPSRDKHACLPYCSLLSRWSTGALQQQPHVRKSSMAQFRVWENNGIDSQTSCVLYLAR